MNTARERMISGHSYMQRQLKQMHKGEGPGAIAGMGRAATETTRLVSDFGRQAMLFAGLAMLVAVILAATTGNELYERFIYWTGLFN